MRTKDLIRKENIYLSVEGAAPNHWVYRFPNNYGASVCRAPDYLEYGEECYEVAVIHFLGDTDNAYEVMEDKDGHPDVNGYFDEEGVDRFLIGIECIPRFNREGPYG